MHGLYERDRTFKVMNKKLIFIVPLQDLHEEQTKIRTKDWC
jgi:replicative superfamily II helicase